ncbi:sensor histidine kinase [Mucilaginibacter sp. FT3.2]|uniref:sensor histidine kinase n=1 Tax=Mucilaginibacter sp. FT3.2 TaxID=2723090 RepID=UPI00162262A4|nr:histidine kinase [Mucilaginibacter sp. FT3.2]MBB6234590.1 two-component sensor histidine kinase [Mucilaginibacter sp. FT3.2]
MKQQKTISLYWRCQLLGWSLAGLFWAFSAWLQVWQSPYPNGYNYWLALLHFVFDIGIGIAVTHTYHFFAHKWGWVYLKLAKMPVRLITAVIIMGAVYMLLVIGKLYQLRYFFNNGLSFGEFFSENYLVVLASGTRLMAIWVLAFHLYHYAVMEINTAKAYARLQIVARDAQLQQLSSQLNPHFFFNSLNSIKALIGTQPEKARRAIDLLSDLLRTSLYGNNTGLISLADEMNLVNDYLELEKIRFEERLQFGIAIDTDLANSLILPLSIQTLAENALKHGIAQQKNGGLVNITIQRQDEEIHITVENPGKIAAVENTGGVGLKNLEERLQLQYAGKASFTLGELPGNTVLATIIIPAS